ncbi:type VI secretion system-associated protein TagF [Microbulbifer sp. ALW1]|uniref:type VI secretion system-associated protein TagF n=1 Tax=Microbulbifer sp. (strain ALW1) TaxID=1516059 RepID=UPI0019112608|nr:type VI secretion system-associated protein TagF [Microbulbifer sp. ALW1]
MDGSMAMKPAGKGIFGKLPGHGDFVQRDLPSSFVTPWDEWLQRAVHGSRELVGEKWLDYYLTSPIWRFALSSGVLSERAWAGILVPSVDSVGRYFPVTMAVPLAAGTNPFDIQVRAESWYAALSELAIEALQNALLVDHLSERFPVLAMLDAGASSPEGAAEQRLLSVEGSIDLAYPGLLEAMCKDQYSSFSLWWCAPSPSVNHNVMLSAGLPDPSVYCTMLGAPKYHW